SGRNGSGGGEGGRGEALGVCGVAGPLAGGFLAGVMRRVVVVFVAGLDALGDLGACGGCLVELCRVFERLGERVAGGVGFAYGLLLACGEPLRECWEVPDAMLELADQWAGVAGDRAERQLGGGGGHVSERDRECPVP